REKIGVAQAEHGAQADNGQHQREDATDPALAETAFFGRGVQVFSEDGHAGGSLSPHRSRTWRLDASKGEGGKREPRKTQKTRKMESEGSGLNRRNRRYQRTRGMVDVRGQVGKPVLRLEIEFVPGPEWVGDLFEGVIPEVGGGAAAGTDRVDGGGG